MIKKIAVLLAALSAFSGCPVFEPALPPDSITVFADGAEQNAVNIETGQTVTLRAEVRPSMKNVSIIWEINNGNAAIVSSGEGAECSIRGIKTGNAGVTVKAWLGSNDSPVSRRIPVAISGAAVTDIVFHGPPGVFAGEERPLNASLVPEWAGGLDITWSDPVNLALAGGKITGGTAGPAAITATAGGKSKTFDITVKAVPALSDLTIYNGTSVVSGGSIEIVLYEEITLNAAVTPESETFFTWASDDPGTVSAENGVVKGLRPGQAAISVGAGGFAGTKQVIVTVKDPVTGIIIKYDNNSDSTSLPVSNVIWLAPNDQVKLKAETSGGVPAEIKWPEGNGGFTLTSSNGGRNCTIAYKDTGPRPRFDDPPVELRVTAKNSGNGAEASAVILVKKLDSRPLWAWDRARDADGNAGLSSINASGSGTAGINGRGEKDNVPAAAWGNAVPNTGYGLKLNSSNNYSGKNPDPAGAPGNSTRIAIGIKERTATSEGTAVDGVFDFLEAFCEKDGDAYKKDPAGNYILKPQAQGKMIRVSVDYEIIWTAGAGRDMWIMLNNNNANAAQSPMRTDSQILIEPLASARGTRATAVTYIDVWDMVDRKFDGIETLEKSFICIITLSNGGNIYVSGIRIEYEE
jgi:uncharacterized protein YjdB